MTDISIIIVTFNHEREIGDCLTSLCDSLKSYKSQIILIDNNSGDGTLAKARAKCSKFDSKHQFLIFENETNVGFTRAVNQGLKKSRGQYILLLNPDTEFGSDVFTKIFELFNRHPRLGIVSPQFLNSDGTIQPSCRRFPRHRDLIYTTFGMSSLLNRSREFNYWKMGDFDFKTQRSVEQPQGAFLLTQISAFEEVGLLDEQFTMFFSDVDWCRRFISHGWDILFYPSVKLIHRKGTSIFKNRVKMIWTSHQSFYRYFKKYYPDKKWWLINLLTAELLIGLGLLRALYHALKK